MYINTYTFIAYLILSMRQTHEETEAQNLKVIAKQGMASRPEYKAQTHSQIYYSKIINVYVLVFSPI